jgi:hypothetical protein
VRRIACALVVASSGLAALAPRDARADAPPPSLTAQSEAQARFQTGLTYYDARDFESARLAFTQAYAVLQKPGILLNLALSELYTNRPVDAINHLERYLAEKDLPVDKRDRAKKAFDDAYKKTGHVALAVLPGTEVKVDGVALASPLPAVLHVAPGTRVLDAVRGKATRAATVQAQAGEKKSVDLRIDDEAAGPMPKAPEVAASAVPAAEPPATSGGGAPREAGAGALDPAPPAGETRSFFGWRAYTGFALVGVGAVGIIVGAVESSDADSSKEKLVALSPSLPSGRSSCLGSSSPLCAQADQLRSERADASALGKTLLWVGGISGGAGFCLLVSAAIWRHPKFLGQSARLGPGPGLAGLSFSTTY